MTNLDISYLVVFTLQIVCDAILVWGALKKIPNHLVPWLWANAVIIAVFLVSKIIAKNLVESDAKKCTLFTLCQTSIRFFLEMMIFKNGSERDSNHVEILLRISEVNLKIATFLCCEFPHF